MSRTVTALYDSRSEAEAAKQRLESAVDTQSVRVIDQSSNEGSSGSSSGESEGSGGGWLSSLFVSHEDRHAYGEGVRRGGAMLCAEVDSDEDADKIIRVLEETSAVDLDQRQESWRSEGWQPQQSMSTGTAAGSASAFGGGATTVSASGGFDSDRTAFERSESSGFDRTGTTGETGDRVVQEEHIPIVKEQLNVGKREVERGGARIRSYVRETPVSEQVSLHEEHVDVERRPVNETLGAAELNRGDLFQEREIEMRATGEEAVVGKEARVVEEVIARKTAGEHTETVQDTVRETDVEVDEGLTRSEERTDREGDRGAFGFGGDNNR